MSAAPQFSRAEAERLPGPAAVERVRQIVAAAPPLGPELREQLRAVFASARAMQKQAPSPTRIGTDEQSTTLPVRGVAEPTRDGGRGVAWAAEPWPYEDGGQHQRPEGLHKMSHESSYDRFEKQIEVGSTVTFAYNDALHGGIVVYIAGPDIAELAIETEKYGLQVRQGKASGDGRVFYDNVIVREPSQ